MSDILLMTQPVLFSFILAYLMLMGEYLRQLILAITGHSFTQNPHPIPKKFDFFDVHYEIIPVC